MKFEIQLIPNFGNEDIIIREVKKMNISSSYKTRPSGFRGCDVPVILDIECEKKEVLKLQKILKKHSFDSFTIYHKCSECGNIRHI